MAPTFCNCCGDALEEGRDPREELAELDALLERIKLKRYDLKRKINRLHSPIVRRLPPDVTSTIFEFCLPFINFSDYQVLAFIGEDISFPLSLGAICTYWRDIAWSTPSLWSSLVIRVKIRHDPRIIADLAQEWLARSGQLPLSIRIFALNNNNDKRVSALAVIINQYSTRWIDLDFCIPSDCYQHFHAIDNHAPTLKFIRFRCSLTADVMSLNFRLTCPRLERASLANVPMKGSNIQWDNLTHLTLDSMSIIDSFLILRKTPQLVFCKVSNTSSFGRRNIGALVLTSLRSLHLPISFAEHFLNNIIAPHLEELSLPYYRNLSMEVITSFLGRSACLLRSLYMDFRSFRPHFEMFMNFFQSMNTLSIISITETATHFDNTTPEDYDQRRNILQLVAKVLSSQSTSPHQGFLPNLKILEYTGMLRIPSGNLDDRYSLPPAGDNAVHALHSFKLDLHPVTRIPKNMMSYFSSLEERGVTVNVLSNSEDILQSSIDYYKHQEESLCRDWADNFDSSLFS